MRSNHKRLVTFFGVALLTGICVTPLRAQARILPNSPPNSILLPNFVANSRLLAAADAGDITELKAALKGGADPDAVSEFGDHAINIASMRGHAAACEVLAQSGAQVDAVSSNGRTPLMDASSSGNFRLLATLLSLKASPLSKTSDGETPLYFAAASGFYAGVRALLNAASDPNTATLDGTTPLMAASRAASWISSPVDFAALADVSNVNQTDGSGATALIIAAESAAPDEIKVLLSHGAKSSVRDGSGRSALASLAQTTEADAAQDAPDGKAMAATVNFEKRQYDVASLLAALTPSATDRIDALLLASAAGCPGVAKGLINEGTPVNDSDTTALSTLLKKPMISESAPRSYWPEGMTPLMVASATGHNEIVAVLLSAHANAAARDAKGRTAIMYAARFGRADIVERLIKHGVDVDAVDSDGRRALMEVADLGWYGMHKQGWVPDSTAGLAASPDTLIARLLMNAGADVKARDLNGNTAFDIATKSRSPIASLVGSE